MRIPIEPNDVKKQFWAELTLRAMNGVKKASETTGFVELSETHRVAPGFDYGKSTETLMLPYVQRMRREPRIPFPGHVEPISGGVV